MRVRVVIEPVPDSSAGDVDVRQTIQWEPLESSDRIPTTVACIGIEIGHIEQQVSAGPPHHLSEEARFVQLTSRPIDEGGDVLESQRESQLSLRPDHVLDDHLKRLACSRNGEQMTRLGSIRTDERQVFTDQTRA